MYNRIELITHKIIEITDANLVEIQNSTCSIIVGIIMMFNGSALYSRNPDAWRMLEWAPAWTWGLLYLSAGSAHLLFLKLRRDWFRKWVLLVKAGLWVFLASNLMFGIGWLVPAVYIYYVFALVAFRGYFKIQAEVRSN